MKINERPKAVMGASHKCTQPTTKAVKVTATAAAMHTIRNEKNIGTNEIDVDNGIKCEKKE